jgi:hypothetical protein
MKTINTSNTQRRDTLLVDVRRDAPQLEWVMKLALVSKVPLDSKLEAVAALKQAILKKGGSEYQWRLLSHTDESRFACLLNHPSTEFPWHTLRLWLQFLERVGATETLPEPVVVLLLNALIVHIGYLIEPDALTRLYPVAVLRILARECVDRAGQQQDLYRKWVADEVTLVLDWANPRRAKLDRNQEKAGWRFLINHARVWQKRTLHKSLLSAESVPHLIDQFTVDPYVVKPLNTAYLLWDEGFAMHHCVGTLWRLAVRNESRFYSIRDQKSDDRVATMEIQADHNGRWEVLDCRERFNHPAKPEIKAIADVLADRYTHAARQAA